MMVARVACIWACHSWSAIVRWQRQGTMGLVRLTGICANLN